MNKILHILANNFPVIAAHIKRIIHNGPRFKRYGNLWRVEDHTGVIYIPFIRRYGMYTQTTVHTNDQP